MPLGCKAINLEVGFFAKGSYGMKNGHALIRDEVNLKKSLSVLLTIGMALGSVPVSSIAQPASSSYYDQSKREVICAEPLPVFTLGEKSNPTQQQVSALCTCIWNKFPKDGWERRTSQLIRNNQDPGWRGGGLLSRFGDAIKACDGMTL
jgi:hypothetical protein